MLHFLKIKSLKTRDFDVYRELKIWTIFSFVIFRSLRVSTFSLVFIGQLPRFLIDFMHSTGSFNGKVLKTPPTH